MTEYDNTPMVEEEEEGIDFLKLLRQLLRGWKTVAVTTAVFTVLGLVAALTMKKQYTASTVIVPQLGSSSSSSSLSSLASLAGIDMTKTSGSELSPLIYPQIVESVPFRLEMLYTPVHYEKCDTAICMFDYARDYGGISVIDTVIKYTVKLPFVILNAIRSKDEPVELDNILDSDAVRPVEIKKEEENFIEILKERIRLSVDNKEGYLTLTVKGDEALQTAELCIKAQQLLQNEITRLRTEKTQAELKYIQARYEEVKEETEFYQDELARIVDRAKDMTTTSAKIEQNRLQSKYNTANSVYQELAKQLEQAKLAVKKDTPVFTVVKPVTLPIKSSNSRLKVLIIWSFFGFIVSCGIVLARGYWPMLKEKWLAEYEDVCDNSVE
ncbi:MAG: hypothetical protein J5732_09450 [Bacteroidaceae bacterium]|nr:hypothetical protein [Bacteroidaceae bacterium]